MTVLALDSGLTWIPACPADRLTPERGVAILLPDGGQVALFRTFDGALYAIDNIDPFSHAAVMARGIVGDRDGEPTVASPMLKQVFSLRTGVCLDDPSVRQAVHTVRERDGVVEVTVRPSGGTA
ncbi:nitrite reductase small subunit NirD [Marinactinospora thermotolerans]|uniref:Nitrite reductase (NADH) small subunit n=1 Tax=Marinactinospora thermotolerans DSM 45154 TaxID=1122192 RepID=A0A1T4PUH0_9ACTN|nr:nitrite reductase small subunit NirD [Marinactinospora thermotolerans]SJZ94976.1 nitrite reductase (NADH) small subunit [Marinactinospora thermotolerans DSM 45154]